MSVLINVKAKDGLRVPLAENPHEYIEQSPVQVEWNLYYQRLISSGDLLEVEPVVNKKGK